MAPRSRRVSCPCRPSPSGLPALDDLSRSLWPPGGRRIVAVDATGHCQPMRLRAMSIGPCRQTACRCPSAQWLRAEDGATMPVRHHCATAACRRSSRCGHAVSRHRLDVVFSLQRGGRICGQLDVRNGGARNIAGSFLCAQLAAQSYMAMGALPIRQLLSKENAEQRTRGGGRNQCRATRTAKRRLPKLPQYGPNRPAMALAQCGQWPSSVNS